MNPQVGKPPPHDPHPIARTSSSAGSPNLPVRSSRPPTFVAASLVSAAKSNDHTKSNRGTSQRIVGTFSAVPKPALRFETNRAPMPLPDRELSHCEADTQLAAPLDRELSHREAGVRLAAPRLSTRHRRFRADPYTQSPSPIHQSINPFLRPPSTIRR
jgi:hypothetical protein